MNIRPKSFAGPLSVWCTGRPGALAMLFVLLTLPLGVFLAGTVPLGHVPDEPAHLLRADGLIYGDIIGHREPLTLPDGRRVLAAGVRANLALLSVVTLPIRPVDQVSPVLTAEMVQRARGLGWNDGPAFVNLGIIAGYCPLFYLPAGIALGGAKIVGMPPFQAYIVARLVNLLCFSAMGTAALLLARRGRAVMFWILAVPMTLSLAASASQDGLLIAAAVLAAALATRVSDDAERPASRSPWYWAAAALIACIAAAKPPYLPLAAMLLLPLAAGRERQSNWLEVGRRLAVVALVSLLVLGWMWLFVADVSVPRVLDPYEAGPLWPGSRPAVFDHTDIGAQLRVLLTAPTLFVSLPAITLWHDAALPREMVGVLGWLNLVLPSWLYLLWGAAMAACVGADCIGASYAAATGSRWLEAPLLVTAAVLAVLAICISQYLAWTPVGMPWIGGPQGRYFLPVIPLLAIALPRLAAPGGKGLRRAVLLLPLTAAAADVLMLPRLIVSFYYLG